LFVNNIGTLVRRQKRYGENDEDDYRIKITIKDELSRAKTSQAELGWTEVAGQRSDLQQAQYQTAQPLNEPNPSVLEDPVYVLPPYADPIPIGVITVIS
jgi:hypothetical protein